MCAIRNKQEYVAEYLINRGINVNFEIKYYVSKKILNVKINIKCINYTGIGSNHTT